ncbi:MAG: bifunctional demethylmenaquinone methyltransferase/2-methoxy-6-polyprenyl-1,4-benzoquinol methylase UbiE [Planctomycetaceae bacterium]|jgi:demethylmenaquinone methyltransferase/2-methoxy-6-polyprenyl-1,4-benzoquinol methylase|nr:bifunctional demethylmenaquinone methyltransferase/2-methoxy-6-polyprenyl-1,4-benzoquinol methylase UbiE [Planctomycetaceae bacterium]
MKSSLPNIDKSPERIQTLFNTIAPRYDFLNHLLSFGIDRYWRWQTVRRLVPAVDGAILDLCTGTADFAIAFAAKNPQRKVVGLDFSANMLDIGRKRIERASLNSQIELVEGNALATPFADDSFALVNVAYGLRNTTDPIQGLREMVRICKPGGTVAVLEFQIPERGWFATLYRFYFRRLLPQIGQFVTGEKVGAYRHLFESVQSFPQGETLAEMMRQAGLSQIVRHPMTFGTIALNIGWLYP